MSIAKRIKRFAGPEAAALRTQVAGTDLRCLRSAGADVIAALTDYSRGADAAIARDFTTGDERVLAAQAALFQADTTLGDCAPGAGTPSPGS